MKSLISRAGDLSKNNDRLKFALVSIRFPEAYNETMAKDGHPTMFLKIVHYALFGSSPSVRDYMFSNGVDKDTVHLNDLKFFKSVTYILVNLFGYKAKITQDQFFKYGYAEMKMLLCCDIITLVKRKQKHLQMHRSLSAKRVMFTRAKNDNGRFSMLAHD